MSTVPVPAGEVATTRVSLTGVKLAAGVPPKLTPVTPVKPVPMIARTVPPAAAPLVGATLVIVGP
jgi:hypothetical protein